MAEIVTNRNCVYQVACYVAWRPEYRREVLTGSGTGNVSADNIRRYIERCEHVMGRR